MVVDSSGDQRAVNLAVYCLTIWTMTDNKKIRTEDRGNGPTISAIRSSGSAAVFATFPPTVVVSENSPIILHSSKVLILGKRGEYGERVVDCTPVFWQILDYAEKHGVEALHALLPSDGRLFEELIAGAYAEHGAEIVELSPRSGDGGVDVWAKYKIPGAGDVTIMDQVKLYAPDNEIDPGDIHRILGADARGTKYSKAVISTTGKIPDVARREVEQYGERVVLRGPEELKRIFDSLIARR